MNSLRLACLSLVTASIYGCGGGGGDSASDGLPDLNAPQAGSTAATTNGFEGVYNSNDGFAFVDARNVIALRTATGFVVAGMKVSEPNWQLDLANLQFSDTATLRSIGPYGTFVPYKTISSTRGDMVLTYAPANALAVSNADLAGIWSGDSSSLHIQSDGRFYGTTGGLAFGQCSLNGLLSRDSPTSLRNQFKIEFRALGPSCKLDQDQIFSGGANIDVVPIPSGVTPRYGRLLRTIAKTDDGAFASFGYTKQ